jgi:hypothetical protein
LPQPLHVDTAELRISAARLDAVNGATTAQLTLNAGALTGCQSGRAGTAFAAFEQVRGNWELADAARGDRLGDIALNLYRSADIYDHRDQASAEDLEECSFAKRFQAKIQLSLEDLR